MNRLNRSLTLFALAALLAPALAWSAAEGKVRIVTSEANPASCIAPIEVFQIDGKEVLELRTMVEVEPGVRTIRGRAVPVDTSFCRVVGRPMGEDVPPLEHNFELGKVYYVGLDHSASRRQEWRIVVHRVEDQ